MKKIKVLVVPSDTFGCGYYRSLRPHTKLQELYPDEFDVTIKYDFNWRDLETIKKQDIVHFHKGVYNDIEGFRKALQFCKENNITTVMDIDDYWDLGPFHPNYLGYKNTGIDKIIKENVPLADYVTTTTPIFEAELKKFNPNVKIFVNAIDPEEEQFIPKDIKKTDRIRFGFIMGSSHQHDLEIVRGMVNRLPKDIMDKIQIVLCGYDLRGTIQMFNERGEMTTRPIKPTESVWYVYEKLLTDDYKTVSPHYSEFLKAYMPNVQYPNVDNEPYKRCWTKDIMNYCTHYNEIDVLMVPLADNKFNSFKSELKLIEAGMMKKAVIVSDFGPYKIGTKNFFEKGGKINEEGNVILIDNMKKDKDWAKAIEKLVKNPDYIEKLRTNLHETIKDKYNLSNVTAERAAWYKEIVKKS